MDIPLNDENRFQVVRRSDDGVVGTGQIQGAVIEYRDAAADPDAGPIRLRRQQFEDGWETMSLTQGLKLRAAP